MGSESSSLRGFTLQDPPWTQPSGLTIYPALLADGRPASVFVYQPENQDKVDKAAKHLKTLRHPCLLRFLSCTVEEDGIYLVTERVQPLEMLIQKLSADEICAGIFDILQALVFLHDRGKVSHNNVCLSSVFVSEDGHWKLGGMEMVCKLTEVAPESAEFGIVPVSLSHARDAFSFGRLVESLLALIKDQSEVVSSFKNTVKNSLLNPEPELRPALSALLSHTYFRNDFLEVVNFLESLTVKTEEEKNEFFKFLLDRVSHLPEDLISSRLVPLLLNQLVFAEPMAVKSFLPYLLRPKRDIMGRNREDCLLSPALFQAKVIPVLMKMFEVHEEHVRVVLLTHIDAYGELFTLKELKDIILPQVLLGLRDTSDMLVAVTLRGLAALVCLLGPEVVVGGGRVKIFKSTTPGFTKTTDTTPEDSPVHFANNQQMLLNHDTKTSLPTVLANRTLSGSDQASQNTLLGNDLDIKKTFKEISRGDLYTNDHLSHATSINQVTICQNALSTSSVNKSSEEWPDWNEPEIGNAEVKENLHENTANTLVFNDPDNELWDDFGSPNELSGNAATKSSNFAHLGTDKKKPNSDLSSFSTVGSWITSTLKPIKETNKTVLKFQKSSQENPAEKKFGSGFDLGEEFTIKVTKKARDPELDWFADMTPEIKSSSVLFNVSNFETGNLVEQYKEIGNEVHNISDTNSSKNGFSSKFAAADHTADMDAEGWGEENDFSWEEDSYN
ncbi:protein-associating with the carboxyl-terminal domain of ezrin isoform X2 [Spea bombifrons]|nr:protein-associating with the carboxyl-terminal domain of ezrin isoform X2 [Spea bombifrons]XP_053325383.1 protein-associating with the carboxyl-terminal domain of ezrin isoform X2 [Spea bombifrons]